MTQSRSTAPVLAVGEVTYGAAAAAVMDDGESMVLQAALPWLGGGRTEQLLAGATRGDSGEGWATFRRGRWLGGFIIAPAGQPLEEAGAAVYRQVFALTRGRHLCRIWNLVPAINAISGGLENYRHFCRGRSLAFEREFGASFQRRLPAASAVGAVAGPLVLAFLASIEGPEHFENPQQVPAFQYPAEYGPRPPSFARATAVTVDGERHLFLSGTAAIRGHATVAPQDLARQLACTVENLRAIAAVGGAGDDVGRRAGWRRSFKVFVRRRTDLAVVQEHLGRELFAPSDFVQYLQADICRAPLLVEVEGTLTKPV